MGQSDVDITPLLLRKITVLGFLLLTNNASIWMVFAYLPFMVLHYFPDLSVAEIGYWAGILGSAFSLGSLSGNLLWGVLADRIGRRPVLIVGLAGTAIAAGMFGFAPNFWVAVVTRFLWGFFNGNIGVGKTYMGEILDDSNNSKGMAIFGVIGGLGRIVGPMLGGFLSSPADHYTVFENTPFESYPFSLPSVLLVSIAVMTLVLVCVTLPETWNPTDAVSYIQLGSVGEEDGSGDEGGGTAMDVSEHSPGPVPHDAQRNTIDTPHDMCSDGDTTTSSRSGYRTKGVSRGATWDEMGGGVELTGPAPSPLLSRITPRARDRDHTHKRRGDALDGDMDLTCGLLTAEDKEDGGDYRNASAPAASPGGPSEPRTFLGGENTPDMNGDNLEACSTKKKKRKKSVSFNGAVQIKIMNSDDIGYGHLKKVAPDDHPVYSGGSNGVSCVDLGDEVDDIETITLMDSGGGRSAEDWPRGLEGNELSEDVYRTGGVRYSNGSELVGGEEDMRVKYSSLWENLKNLRSQKMVTISTTLYGLLSLMHVIMVEVFPLWLVVPVRQGGFGFNSYAIGTALTVAGPVALFSQLVVYPQLIERYGSVKVFRNGVGAYGLCCFVMPVLALVRLSDLHGLVATFVVTLYAIASSVIGWSFVSIFVLINNSCYSHQRGTVNGIGQTFASAGRLIGPVAGGSLFAWTESNKLMWPLNYALVWIVVSVLAVYIYRLSFRLPKKILKKRREPRVPRYAITMEQHRGIGTTSL